MHFPTSLPKASGSPVAKIDFNPPRHSNRLSVHAEAFDGPSPPPAKVRDPRVSGAPHSEPRQRPKSRYVSPTAARPVYAHNLPKWASSHTDTQDGAGQPQRRPYMSGALVGRPPIDPRKAFRKNPGKNGEEVSSLEVPATDGHSGDKATSKSKSKLKAVRSSELRKIFQKKETKGKDVREPSPELMPQNEPLKTPKGSDSQNNHLASQSQSKKPSEENWDLEDSDYYPLEGAKKRMNDMRKRKMRRASVSSKSSKNDPALETSFSPDYASQYDHDKHRHSISESTKEFMHGPVEKYEAYRSSAQLEKEEVEEGVSGSRVGNAVRRMSAQFMSNEEEKDAGARRTSWSRSVEERRQSNEGQAGPRPEEIPSSSASSPERIDYVNLNLSSPPNNFPSAPVSPRTKPGSLDQGYKPIGQPFQQSGFRQEIPSMPLYGVSPMQPRGNPYSQVMYPPRPAPFYRPTLSPVSSRSPVPTSVGHGVSPSPGMEKSRTVSASPKVKPPEKEIPASSLRHPVSSINSGSILPTVPKTGGLVVVNGLPATPSSSSEASTSKNSPRKNPVLAPITEARSPEKNKTQAGNNMPQLAFSPQLRDMGDEARKNQQSENNVPKTSNIYASPLSAMTRPHSPPPEHTPSPLKVTAKTPTASALEFWREADESLAPSDSASAQPPNYRREPAATASFWKTADQSLTIRKSGPSMEEWIASLPGLGLGLGPWGNSDGALDWKMFETIRTKSKSNGSKSSANKEAKTASDKFTVQDLIDQSIEKLEEVVDEIDAGSQIVLDEAEAAGVDDGLTPDEAEAIEDDDEDLSARNRPPPVIDRDLLHPDYRPGSSSNSVISSLQAPESIIVGGQEFALPKFPRGRSKNLARDVESRLDALEKYWAEQVVIMGTVYKKMLVLVDNMIIKEREQEQRKSRMRQMGWAEDDEEEEKEKRVEESEEEDTQRAELSPSTCNLT